MHDDIEPLIITSLRAAEFEWEDELNKNDSAWNRSSHESFNGERSFSNIYIQGLSEKTSTDFERFPNHYFQHQTQDIMEETDG